MDDVDTAYIEFTNHHRLHWVGCSFYKKVHKKGSSKGNAVAKR